MKNGTVDKVKGRVKEAVGALLGDTKLKREGRGDQMAGRVKDAAAQVVDEARDFVKDRS